MGNSKTLVLIFAFISLVIVIIATVTIGCTVNSSNPEATQSQEQGTTKYTIQHELNGWVFTYKTDS